MRFKAIATALIGAGSVLGLTRDQAGARAHRLHPVAGRDGWYVNDSPVQFKAGEEFDYEGELPKVLAQAVAPEGAPAPSAAPYIPPHPQATRGRRKP